MALSVLDGLAVLKSLKTTLSGSDHVPHHNVDSSALPTGASTEATLGTASSTLTSLLAKFGALRTAGADAVANTLDRVATEASLFLYNGTTWDRARGDTTNGLDVDVTRSALPTGAASETTLGTASSTLTSLLAKFGALRTAGADAVANTLDRVATETSLFFYNGATWDRARGDTTNGLDVDVTRLPALVAGTANIGDVDVLTLPALPAGTNNIGDVDVLTLPALPAGTNNIGDVDVLTLPALPAGTNAIGKLAANSGVDIGDVDVTSITPGTAATSLGKAEDSPHTTADVGVFMLAVRDDAISADAADGDYIALKVGSDGRLYCRVVQDPPSAVAHSNVSGAATDTQLLASNSSRKFFSVYNDSTAICYVKYATGASATSFAVALQAGGYFEDTTGWTGVVNALWASATGSARIVEIT